ncbi:MAG: hypothetical protein IBX44_00020 [Sulfurospirillum sp.]|nr:hypothetical protein [Sulfurospirillum sp.]
MFKNITKNNIVIFTILTFLTCLAWLNILDKAAYVMNLESLKETSIVFASLKSFESIIGLASNVSIIGGLFEPLKEFVGQMSWVMLISLMSLGLQKVIIVFMQSFIVNAILTLIVFFFIFVKIKNTFSIEFTNQVLRIVFLLLFLRFVIPLMTFSVISVESGLESMKAQVSEERIQKLQNKITSMHQSAEDDKKLEKEKELKIASLESKIKTLETERNQLKEDIKAIKKSDKTLLESVTTIFEEQDAKTKEQIEKKEEKILNINNEIKVIEKEIDDSDSFWDFGIKSKTDAILAKIKSSSEEIFDTFITLVVLFLFKNVLLPILFILGLAKLVDRAFNTNYEKNLKKFRDDKILNKTIE